MTKVLIWLASGDREKLAPGVLWGVNAHRHGWVDEVRFVVFGAAEELMLEDEELFPMIQEVNGPLYCRHVARKAGIEGALEGRGARLEYVGEPIAQMIAAGYTVLTF